MQADLPQLRLAVIIERVTEKLYYDDPDLLEFTARVVRVTAGADEGRASVVLDRTAFYPEGGGQPCDTGTIDGHTVVDVQKKAGEVIHMVAAAAGSFPREGAVVTGSLDGDRRRDYRQQHTGQHIISAALVKCGGHNTVSVHLGTDYSTIEVDSDSISDADIRAVEETANATIERAVPVKTSWVAESEIGSYPLRREPKVSGTIRVVQVGDADCVACGGVHVSNSRQVRLVRCIGSESIRGRVRLLWKIGDRALEDYRLKDLAVRNIGGQLSAQPHEIVERVAKLGEQVRELESTSKRQRERICRLAADSLMAGAETEKGRRVITAEFHNEEKDILRGICKALSEETGILACLTNDTGDQLQWSIVAGPASGADVPGMLDELLPVIDGKGGGKPTMWQGIGQNRAAAGEFLATFRSLAGA